MTDVTYIRGAQPDDGEPAEPNLALIKYLETLLARARSGELQGVVTVGMDADGYAGYGLVGRCGGFAMQGALTCVSTLMAEVNLSQIDDE